MMMRVTPTNRNRRNDKNFIMFLELSSRDLHNEWRLGFLSLVEIIIMNENLMIGQKTKRSQNLKQVTSE